MRKKSTIVLLLFVLIFSSLSYAEYNSTVSVPIDIPESGDYVVTVKWSDYPLDIELVLPDGKRVSQNNSDLFFEDSKCAYLVFTSDDSGEINLLLSKDREEEQDVKVHTQMISDEWFLITEMAIDFEDGDAYLNYNIESLKTVYGEIKLVFEPSNGVAAYKKEVEGIQFKSGSNRSKLDLPTITPGFYNVYAQVKSDTYMDIFNINNSLEFTSDDKQKSEVEIISEKKIENTYHVEFEPRDEFQIYEIALYPDMQSQPIEYYEVVDPSFEFILNDSKKTYYYSVVGNGRHGEKSIEVLHEITGMSLSEMGLSVTWPSADVIVDEYIELNIEVQDNIKFDIYVDNELAIEDLESSGVYSVKVPQGECSVGILAEDKSGNLVSEVKSFYVDSLEPTLFIYSDEDAISQSMPLQGKTEVSAELTLNNEEVALGDKGDFAIDLKSKDLLDKNVLVAKDTLGNESVFEFSIQDHIEEEVNSNIYMDYLGLIAGVIVGMSYSIYLIVSLKKDKRAVKNKS